jgi:hypothetical protein
MSLMSELEKMAYKPLSDTNRVLHYLNNQNLNNNHAIKEQLIKELSVGKPNIRYDLFACETHVVSVS